jgi:hypothetical protein
MNDAWAGIALLFALCDAYLTNEKLALLGPAFEENPLVRKAAEVHPILGAWVIMTLSVGMVAFLYFVAPIMLGFYAGTKFALVLMHHRANEFFKTISGDINAKQPPSTE